MLDPWSSLAEMERNRWVRKGLILRYKGGRSLRNAPQKPIDQAQAELSWKSQRILLETRNQVNVERMPKFIWAPLAGRNVRRSNVAQEQWIRPKPLHLQIIEIIEPALNKQRNHFLT